MRLEPGLMTLGGALIYEGEGRVPTTHGNGCLKGMLNPRSHRSRDLKLWRGILRPRWVGRGSDDESERRQKVNRGGREELYTCSMALRGVDLVAFKLGGSR